MRTLVFDIKKFAVNDGPGIRTAVFLKGCPLRCLWCHNPESQKPGTEIFFMPAKCIGCGWCFEKCPEHCHVMTDGRHEFRREKCRACGLCASRCYARALEVVGREMTPEEVLAEVLKDRAFYENSGGGMTVSGGEPMMHFDFTLALCRLAREAGIHVCLDTSGQAPTEEYERINPFVDLYLWDVKATDPEQHRRFTGVDNRLIRRNLMTLDALGAATILRCPLVPGVNDDPGHLAGIAELADSLKHVREIHVEPYHPLGVDKAARLGAAPRLERREFTDDDTVRGWIAAIAARTSVPVRKS